MAQADFTARYAALLEHCGRDGTRDDRGLGHENGSVASSPRYLKEAVNPPVTRRGQREFADRPADHEFVREG
ncbi:hypothetical protein [Pandoraea sputorum]|uniref:Integrase n=1 Tax=Pandoraea sputorum TaxID=93222 RepID=A0A5E5BFG0_9BURK|nr:hypothetical protein [Pandoraea sputorum]VVE84639.1 integrase [Pandoraea sputorum]